jgi:C-terminal processing protease CtpA/Prc
MRRLPTGDLFQFATADIQTPRGESIEGVGVAPDEPVPRKIEDFAAGRDRTREVAEAWLRNRELRAGPGSLENTARAP